MVNISLGRVARSCESLKRRREKSRLRAAKQRFDYFTDENRWFDSVATTLLTLIHTFIHLLGLPAWTMTPSLVQPPWCLPGCL